MNSIKALAGHIKESFVEGYTLLLVAVGLPAIAYIYIDWRAALAVFVLSQIGLCYLKLKVSN
jgi:hypothetical protein